MNSPGASIERSTWVSAAKLTIASQPVDRGLDRLGVGDVGDDQLEPLGVEPLEVLLAPGVGELVEHPDPEVGMGLEPVADVGGADEPGPAGDQHVHTPALASRADRYSLSPWRHSGRVIGSGRSEASSESGGRGAGRPSISVVPAITRVSRPAWSKISCA